MRSSRTLARIALLALLCAGLTGCADRLGDLGAARNEEAPLARSEPQNKDAGLVAEVVDVQEAAQPVPAPQEPKEAVAELVSLQPAPLAEPAPALAAQPAQEIAADDGKPKEGAAPAPAAESAEERAAKLLHEAERLSGVDNQAKQQESEAAYQAGLKLFNNLEYEDAQKYFERAVQLCPGHSDAQQKLRTVNALLGVHVNVMREKLKELETSERVRLQENMMMLAKAMEDGRIQEERGSATALEKEAVEKEKELSEQLEHLRRAQDQYRRILEIVNWMPPGFEVPAMRAKVDAAIGRTKEKMAEKEEEVSFLRRAEADKAASKARVRETDQFKARVAKLLDQVKELYDKTRYQDAERLALRVLQIDPLNGDAEGWKQKARAAYHSNEQLNAADLNREQYKRSWEDVEADSISYGVQLIYPSNWDQICKRSETDTIGAQVKEESWKSDIRKKLQRKVTFEFIDTPLDEAVSFLRSLANVTMIVDPKVLAGGAPTINLRVTDMSLDLALEWILKLADLEYAMRDSAIFISKPANLQASVELRIYDVSDLTQAIQDFPGPDFQVSVVGDVGAAGGAGGAGGAGNIIVGAPKVTPTLTNIADMIKNRVKPESWDPALGTSIDERGGKLVVMQRPEIHALIVQLLSNFRATQKMMINIEARFLLIREAYLEDIGVEFQGLDPNVLKGDFGDINRLGVQQPRNSLANDAPFPGLVNGVDNVAGGMLTEVGSIVNHVINFANNDTTTISGFDGGNAVRQGGFSGQVTILNNTQVQAFIKSLAVHENNSLLFAPRLTVFNTQRASMFVARQQSYVANYEISGDSYDPVIRQFLVGVVLDVRPIVSSDRRYVTMELRPTETELVSFVTRQINAYTINNGGTVAIIIFLHFPIQFPELLIRRVRTTATVPDGGILLLGGLHTNLKFHAENGVPFLSDLPVIGRLFRWNTMDNARTNLAILVSPRIILFSEEEEKL